MWSPREPTRDVQKSEVRGRGHGGLARWREVYQSDMGFSHANEILPGQLWVCFNNGPCHNPGHFERNNDALDYGMHCVLRQSHVGRQDLRIPGKKCRSRNGLGRLRECFSCKNVAFSNQKPYPLRGAPNIMMG